MCESQVLLIDNTHNKFQNLDPNTQIMKIPTIFEKNWDCTFDFIEWWTNFDLSELLIDPTY